MNRKMSHEAVEWLILNESDETDGTEIERRWEEWCAEPANRAEYVRLMQLAEDLHVLPPPEPASRRELLEDVAAEGEGNPGLFQSRPVPPRPLRTKRTVQ